MKNKTIKLLLVLLLFPGVSIYGHTDTLIKLSETGALSNLPKKFLPASLIATRTEVGSLSVSLQLSGNEILLPECISKLFILPENEEYRLSASWYHNSSRSGLPPYLSIDLPTKTSDGFYEGHSLLFNLESAALIEINKHELLDNNLTMTQQSIAPNSLCSKTELSKIKLTPLKN